MASLNEVHQHQLGRFNAYTARKREQAVIDRDSEKEEFVSDQLADEAAIFNHGDVVNLLNAYHGQVRQRLSEELEKMSGLSAVFASELMAQAEQSGLSLQVEDIAVIEDSSRVGAVAGLAALRAAPAVPKPQAGLLPTIGSGAADPAMLQELSDMKEEKRQMTDRYQQMQSEVSSLLKERSKLSEELDKVKQNFKQMMQRSAGGDAASNQNAAEIERLLNATKADLDARSQECEAMRKDLNQRLGDSTQFRDLKAIVKKKNEENRDLKSKLAALGHPVASEGGIELEADSD